MLLEAECNGIVLRPEELSAVVDSPGGSEALEQVVEDSIRGGKAFGGGAGAGAAAGAGGGDHQKDPDEPSSASAGAVSSGGKTGKDRSAASAAAEASLASLKGGVGWGTSSGRKRHGGAAVRELIRLGPLVGRRARVL